MIHIINLIDKGTQRGANIHIQGHAMYPIIFNTINTATAIPNNDFIIINLKTKSPEGLYVNDQK